MPVDLIPHLPSNWVGLFAIIAFISYTFAQVVEKFPLVAKHVPLGKWWHQRQKKKGTRGSWVAEDNEVISGMQQQITTVVTDLAAVNEKLRAFTAFSVYDARYHHMIEIQHADGACSCELPKHYGYFEFERIWRADPVAAATL